MLQEPTQEVNVTHRTKTRPYRSIRLPNGECIPIEDAPLGATLQVTAEDILYAIPNDPLHCTLALAGHRSLGTGYAVVWKTTALFEVPAAIGREHKMIRYSLPNLTRRLVVDATDNEEPVAPGFYPLNVPADHARLGASHKPADGSRPKRHQPSRKPRIWQGPRGNFTLRATTSPE